MENNIHASLPVNFSIDKSFDNNKFVKLRLDFAHDGINRKHTRFTKELLEAKQDGLYLSPLLGNIIETEDGSYKFGQHDMEFRPNPFKNNNLQMFYIENILGIIPPKEYADFEIKQVNGQNRVFVTGYLYKKYSNFAEDILAQYENTPVSMETNITKYTYSADEDVYDILDFEYLGITFLGQEVTAAMEGANVQLYAETPNMKEQMVVILQELKQVFSFEVDDKKIKEGGLLMNDNQNTEPVIENEVKETNTVTPVTEENNVSVTPENSDTTEDPEVPEVDTDLNTTEGESSTTENFGADSVPAGATEVEVSNTEPTDYIKTFSISHDDIRRQLYEKLTATEQADQKCYYIEAVYDNYFEYSSYEDGHYYKQAYSIEAEQVTFAGERIELYIEKLTSDEKAVLDAMRQNYDSQITELNSLREFKANYDMAEKQAVMTKWSAKIGNTKEFAELSENETFKNYAIDELETKCKCIFADNVAFSCNFSASSAKRDKDFIPVSVSVGEVKESNNETKPYNGFVEEYASK